MLFWPGVIANGPVSRCTRVAPAGTVSEMIWVDGRDGSGSWSTRGRFAPFELVALLEPLPLQAVTASRPAHEQADRELSPGMLHPARVPDVAAIGARGRTRSRSGRSPNGDIHLKASRAGLSDGDTPLREEPQHSSRARFSPPGLAPRPVHRGRGRRAGARRHRRDRRSGARRRHAVVRQRADRRADAPRSPRRGTASSATLVAYLTAHGHVQQASARAYDPQPDCVLADRCDRLLPGRLLRPGCRRRVDRLGREHRASRPRQGQRRPRSRPLVRVAGRVRRRTPTRPSCTTTPSATARTSRASSPVVTAPSPTPRRSRPNVDGEFAGVAPLSRTISIKVADGRGATDVTQVIAAVDWVVKHAHDKGINIRVINLSYGLVAADQLARRRAQLQRRAGVAGRHRRGRGGGQLRASASAGNDAGLTLAGVQPGHHRGRCRRLDQRPGVLLEQLEQYEHAAARLLGAGFARRPAQPGFDRRRRHHRSVRRQGHGIAGVRAADRRRRRPLLEGQRNVAGCRARCRVRSRSCSPATPNSTPDAVKQVLRQTATPVNSGSRRVTGEGLVSLDDAYARFSGSLRRFTQNNDKVDRRTQHRVGPRLDGRRPRESRLRTTSSGPTGIALTGDVDWLGNPVNVTTLQKAEKVDPNHSPYCLDQSDWVAQSAFNARSSKCTAATPGYELHADGLDPGDSHHDATEPRRPSRAARRGTASS